MLDTGNLRVVLACRIHPRYPDSYRILFSIYLWSRIILLQVLPALVLCVCNVSLIVVSCRTFRYRRQLIGAMGVLRRDNPVFVSDSAVTVGTMSLTDVKSSHVEGLQKNSVHFSPGELNQKKHSDSEVNDSFKHHDEKVKGEEHEDELLSNSSHTRRRHGDSMLNQDCQDRKVNTVDRNEHDMHLTLFSSISQEKTTAELNLEEKSSLCNSYSFPDQQDLNYQTPENTREQESTKNTGSNEEMHSEEANIQEVTDISDIKVDKENHLQQKKSGTVRHFIDAADGQDSWFELNADTNNFQEPLTDHADIDENWTFMHFGQIHRNSRQTSTNTSTLNICSISQHVTMTFPTDQEAIETLHSSEATSTDFQNHLTVECTDNSSNRSSLDTDRLRPTQPVHIDSNQTTKPINNSMNGVSTNFSNKNDSSNEASAMAELRPSIMLVLVTSCTLLAELIVTIAIILTFFKSIAFPEANIVSNTFLNTYVMSSNLLTIITIPLNFLFFYGLSRQFRSTVKEKAHKLYTCTSKIRGK